MIHQKTIYKNSLNTTKVQLNRVAISTLQGVNGL